MSNILPLQAGVKSLNNQEIVRMVEQKQLPSYKLESALGNPLRAVGIRRKIVAPLTGNPGSMDSLPYDHYDYTKVNLFYYQLGFKESHLFCSNYSKYGNYIQTKMIS